MFNFTTTTIVNDAASIVAASGKFLVKYGPELKKDADHTPCLVKKTPYAAAVKAKATITKAAIEACTSGVYRIAMYIRLRNNNNPYFSNDWTFKGKPLFVEFNGGASVADIVSLVKKYMLVQYGYNLVDVKKSGDDLVIEAHDQWEMFMDQDSKAGVVLEKLTSTTIDGTLTRDEFKALASQSGVTVANGNEAFGDFAHIVKDLRLPSAANRRWQGIAEGDVFGDEPNDDKPLPTGHYTQYTIQLTADRGVMGQSAVGEVSTSRTVHVFYVESAAVAAFDKGLIDAGIVTDKATSGNTTNVVDADEVGDAETV